MMPFEKIGHALSRGVGDGPDDERRRQVRRAFIERASRRGAVRKQTWAFAIAGLAVAIAVTIGVVRFRNDSMSFWIGDTPVAAVPGRPLLAPATSPLPIHFVDGTEIVLTAGSRASVKQATKQMVEITVDAGAVDAYVKPGHHWTFTAGPYRVHVLGTQLHVAWEEAAQNVSVEVSVGAVSVNGPNLPSEGTRVVAGQRLDTVSGAAKAQAVDIGRDTAPETPVAPLAESAAIEAPHAPAHKRASAPDEPWRVQAAAGDYASALASAKRLDFAKLVNESDLADLTKLADIARYASAPAEARLALEAQIRRFPGSAVARRAPFLLGRVELELEHDGRAASEHLRQYLTADPHGELAEQAQGRLIEALLLVGDRVAARDTASSYLTQYPNGAYGKLARSVVVP